MDDIQIATEEEIKDWEKADIELARRRPRTDGPQYYFPPVMSALDCHDLALMALSPERFATDPAIAGKSTGATMNATDGEKAGTESVKEQVPPSDCEGTLLPPSLCRLGYINFYNKVMDLQKHDPDKLRHATNSSSVLRNNIAPEKIKSLQPTTLQDLAKRVNHIHDDKVLFVKTTYHAFRIPPVEVNVLVEDDNGDCIMLSLYNYLTTHDDPSEFLPIGSYLAILAPFIKHARNDPNESLLLRCENPECIRLFPFYRSWLAAKHGKMMLADSNDDPNVLREEGNDLFAKQKYEAAVRKYSQALSCTATISDSTRIACLGNRAEANVRMERWEAAERDARAVLLLDPCHVKARYRLARALLHLNQLSEAHELASMLHAESAPKKNKVFDQLLHDVNQACKEQNEGNYDRRQMENEVSRHGTTLFHANFTSPKIEQGVLVVKPSGFTYRGCIARETLAANTLITASKAFTALPPRGLNPGQNADETSSRSEYENNLFVLLHRRPELKEKFYLLSSGTPDDTMAPGSSIPRDSRLDMNHIENIIAANTFAIDPEKYALAGHGIWINESLFNNSCIANCKWSTIGNHMFVETTRNVQAGEELCLAYLDPQHTFAAREKVFSKWLAPGVGFRCECDLCSLMRDSPELCHAEEDIESTIRAIEKSMLFHPKDAAQTINQRLPNDVRAKYLKMYSQSPLTKQNFFAGWLWIMEACCLLQIQKPEAAMDALKKGAAIMDSLYNPGHRYLFFHSCWIIGLSMALGYVTEAYTLLSKNWEDFVPDITHPDDLRGQFIDASSRYPLPWWHGVDGSTNTAADKMEALTRMALEASSKPRGKGKEKLIDR